MPRTVHVFAGLVLAVGAGLAACGSDGGSGVGDATPDSGIINGDGGIFGDGNPFNADDTKRIFFEPATATVTIDGTGPKAASYILKAEHKDGSITMVSADSIQFDRPDLAKLTPGNPVVATAAGPFAGVGKIHALYKGLEAIGQLRVILQIEYVQPGVDPAAVAALKGASLPADPSVTALLYPYDATVFPLGLSSPLMMWNAPQANDVYRVHYDETNYSYDGYYKVGALGQQRVDQAAWDRVTASNDGSPLHMKLSRYNAATTTAYSSTAQSWTIAPASLRGAIYYWTTSAGGHLSKIQPGTGAAPIPINGGQCMGCHAVSADGTTLVAAVENGAVNRSWVSFNLPGVSTDGGAPPVASVRIDSAQFGANIAANPNGKYVVYGTNPLLLGNAATGANIIGSGLEGMALDTGMATYAHPAFSPDGKHLAAVQSSGNWVNWQASKLSMMDFDEGTLKFSNLKGLVPSTSPLFSGGQHAIAYPSFTPDSQNLAFHVADQATGCNPNGCDANTPGVSSIWLQKTSGADPIRLTALDDSSLKPADDNLAFEPTFNPVERGGYHWVVFTSTRDWGNAPEVSGAAVNGKKRLWVAAIDKVTGATDPSHPAFFLEGQEITTMNMRGFWALAACTPTAGGGACSGGFECCSGFCDQGVCIDVSQVTCKATGESCTMSSDCCNNPSVQCQGGICKSPLR